MKVAIYFGNKSKKLLFALLIAFNLKKISPTNSVVRQRDGLQHLGPIKRRTWHGRQQISIQQQFLKQNARKINKGKYISASKNNFLLQNTFLNKYKAFIIILFVPHLFK